MPPFTAAAVARALDHAVLRPEYTSRDLAAHAAMCIERGVGCICVRPCDVAAAARLVAGSPVAVASVIGFPHGANTTAVKVAETERAVADGAIELDVVVNLSWVLDGRFDGVRDEIVALTDATHAGGGLVKVIFENCFLDDAAKLRLCAICTEAGADWVKTSTGFGPGGATEADVVLMRRACPPRVGVKAAGGIRDLDTLERYRALGADRVGASRTRDIAAEARKRAGL